MEGPAFEGEPGGEGEVETRIYESKRRRTLSLTAPPRWGVVVVRSGDRHEGHRRNPKRPRLAAPSRCNAASATPRESTSVRARARWIGFPDKRAPPPSFGCRRPLND